MAKQSKGKVSGKKVKRINKNLNKMAKRGKLKGKMKSKFRDVQAARSATAKTKADTIRKDWLISRETRDLEEDEDILPIDMIDDDDIILTSSELKSHNIEKKGTTANCDNWEMKARKFTSNEDSDRFKHLLPIKTVSGQVVQRFMEHKDDIADNIHLTASISNTEEENEDNEFAETAPKTTAEVFYQREKSLNEYKERIAFLCHLLLEDPQKEIHKLKELLMLASGHVSDLLVQSLVQKLSIASLTEIFVDLIPGYRIRERTETEKAVKLKKETKHLVEFEESLLRYYKQYLQLLETEAYSNTFSLHAVRSLCILLNKQPHFNYRTNIISAIIPMTCSRNDTVSQLCCECLKQLFHDDIYGDISLEAVRSINKQVKEKSNEVGVKLLETLLALRIKEVDWKDGEFEKKTLNKKKHKLIRKSKKERKYQKQLDELEKELREAEAEENKNTRLKLNTKIMDVVFTIYFRVLKKSPKSKMLVPVLEGLSKFAHLINLDFFDDLVSCLQHLIEHGELKTLDCLYCIHCVFVILSGEGQVLNIDPYRFYKHLYTLLPKIVLESNKDFQHKQFMICFKCLDIMLNQRRKQVSLGRVAAFVKRLSLLSFCMNSQFALVSLAAIRTFFVSHPKLEFLIDSEPGGSGRYLSYIDDPEHCNALSANILELKLFERHSESLVHQLSVHILSGLPSHGAKRTTTEITGRKPWEFIENVETSPSSNALVPINLVQKKMKEKTDSSDFCRNLECLINERLRNKS